MAEIEQKTIELKRPNIKRVEVTLVGITPLLTSRLCITAKDLDPPEKGGLAGAPKVKLPPAEQQYLNSRYMISEKKHGFPATGIKKAMISAVRILQEGKLIKLSQIAAKSMFNVYSTTGHKYMELRFDRVEHDENVARNKRGGTVPVHRALYYGWQCDCVIEFDADILSENSVLSILARAGQVGIGALRPECNGTNGMYEVRTKERRKGRAGRKSA